LNIVLIDLFEDAIISGLKHMSGADACRNIGQFRLEPESYSNLPL
jgi:hypothetical protein